MSKENASRQEMSKRMCKNIIWNFNQKV